MYVLNTNNNKTPMPLAHFKLSFELRRTYMQISAVQKSFDFFSVFDTQVDFFSSKFIKTCQSINQN